MYVITRGDYIIKADGWQDGVGDFYVYEVASDFWTDSLTFWTFPGHE